MYSAELERHQKQSAEWKKKAENLEEKVVSLQVGWAIKLNHVKLNCNFSLSKQSTWPSADPLFFEGVYNPVFGKDK